MKKLIFCLAFAPFFTLLAAGLPALNVQAAGGDFDVQKAITEGNHKGLAQYYKEKAQKYRDRAASHDKMAAEYKKSHVHYKGMETAMPAHCEILKKRAMETATQYEELAKAEEKLAGQ